MASRSIMFFVAICLIATAVDGYRGNFGGFGGFPFSPEAFVAQNVRLPWYGNNLPSIPPMTFPKIPSKDEVINTNVPPGQQYQGMYMSSNSNGDTELIINRNGQVYKQKIPKPDGNTPQLAVPNILMPTIDIPSFDHVFQPIDPETIKKRVPSSPNENFIAHSSSSHSSYSNNNGVEKSSGRIYSVINKNGKVEETVFKFGD